jgi:hypothetical protein
MMITPLLLGVAFGFSQGVKERRRESVTGTQACGPKSAFNMTKNIQHCNQIQHTHGYRM